MSTSVVSVIMQLAPGLSGTYPLIISTSVTEPLKKRLMVYSGNTLVFPGLCLGDHGSQENNSLSILSLQALTFSYFSTMVPRSFSDITLKDTVPFCWWITTFTSVINTPELKVHHHYWEYLFELSFRQSYPSFMQMLKSIKDKKSFQRNLHCSHHQSK